MERIKEVLSEGEHPIYLYGSDDGSTRAIRLNEAEGSQDGSETHEESALSATSDEQLPDSPPRGGEIGASPDSKLLVYNEIRAKNRAVNRTRNLLVNDLVSSAPSSSNGARDHSDEGPDSSQQSGSDSDSISSTSSDNSDLDGNLQAGVGDQFQDGDSPIPYFIEDSDLDEIVRQTLILYRRQNN